MASPDVPKDFLLSLVSGIARSYQLSAYVCPVLLVVAVSLICLIGSHKFWRDFASQHLRWSRFVLFLALIAMMFLIGGTGNWLADQMKGTLSPEFPNLTITVIKLGIYGLEFGQQLAT